MCHKCALSPGDRSALYPSGHDIFFIRYNQFPNLMIAAVECERLSAITLGLICKLIVQQLIKFLSRRLSLFFYENISCLFVASRSLAKQHLHDLPGKSPQVQVSPVRPAISTGTLHRCRVAGAPHPGTGYSRLPACKSGSTDCDSHPDRDHSPDRDHRLVPAISNRHAIGFSHLHRDARYVSRPGSLNSRR